MKELIELIAKKITDHPEDVQVRMIESEDGQQYELQVNPEDMGKVIGLLRGKYAGQMDFGKASGLVKAKLSG